MSEYSIDSIKNETIFSKSESANNGGFFPIGKNSLWHGGIHLPYDNLNAAVMPLISGEIISYRLDRTELQAFLPEKLSLSILNEYNFKTKVENELVTLKDCYEYKTGLFSSHIFKIKEKYRNKKFTIGSGNYILLKNKIELEQNNIIEFYTLYMHLLPVEKYLLESKDCVYKIKTDEQQTNVNNIIKKELKNPFYIKWKCKVINSLKNNVYALKIEEKKIPPYYSVNLVQEDYFKSSFSLNKNSKLNVMHENFKFETKYKNLVLNGSIELKSKKDKIYLLKSISDFASYKPPLFTTNKGLIYTYQEHDQENSKFRKVELRQKHNGNKEIQDSRKIYHSGFVPTKNISEDEKNKKKYINKSCYLRYPDLSINPPKDLFIINQEKDKIWVNSKYSLYSQGANEAEIFLPTSTVVLNILKRDDNDNSFLQVKIAEMCLFVSEEDLEQDKEDSNKYKVKEKLSHPIYIVDDKAKSFKNELRFSFEQDESITNGKLRTMKRIVFGEKGEHLLNKTLIALSDNNSEYTEENIDKIKYRRLVYHSDTSFWVQEEAFESRVKLSGEKLSDIIGKDTIKTKLDWKKVKNIKDLSLKIYEQPFDPIEYFFYTRNKKLQIIKMDFSKLKTENLSKNSDLEKINVKLYCMKTSQFLHEGTSIEIFDINKIDYEKKLKLKYINTWEELSDSDYTSIVQVSSIDEGFFYINEDDVSIFTSKNGYIKPKTEDTGEDYTCIENCFIKCSSKNKETADGLITYEDISKLELTTYPNIDSNFIELQTQGKSIYLYCPVEAIGNNLELSNFFDNRDLKGNTLLPSDCLGFVGNFLKSRNFIHLSLFTKEKISRLNFNYFFLKENLCYKIGILQRRQEADIKKLYLPTNEISFDILNKNKITKDYTGPLCVRLTSMYVYIHRDDFHMKEPESLLEEKLYNYWREYWTNEKFKYPIYLYDKKNKIDFNDTNNTIEKLKNICIDFFDNGTVMYNKKLQKINVRTGENLFSDLDKTSPEYFRFKIKNPNGPIYYIYKNEVCEDIIRQSKNSQTFCKITDDCKYFKIINKTENLLELKVSDKIDYMTFENININKNDISFPIFKRQLEYQAVYTQPTPNKISEEYYYKIPLTKLDKTSVEVYVKKEEVDKKARRNKLKLEDFFNVQVADNNEDLRCDIQKDIIEKLNAQKDEGLEIIKKIEQVYTGTDKYKAAREELRRMACKFPFEWDKEFYNPNKYSYMTDIAKNVMDAADIREKLNSIEELKDEKCFYHFNPAYFMGKLDEWGLLEFNPYEGEKYEYEWKYYDVNRTTYPKTQFVKSNPGFAPLSINGAGVKAFGKLFAHPNGLFREKYSGNSGPYGHEGLDFDGAIGT